KFIISKTAYLANRSTTRRNCTHTQRCQREPNPSLLITVAIEMPSKGSSTKSSIMAAGDRANSTANCRNGKHRAELGSQRRRYPDHPKNRQPCVSASANRHLAAQRRKAEPRAARLASKHLVLPKRNTSDVARHSAHQIAKVLKY